MKNLIIILLTALSFHFTNAQEFKETKKYNVANRLDTKQQEYATAVFDIVAMDDHSKKVATLSIIDLDFFEDITISVLPNPNLGRINEIIKVDINYAACCTYSEIHYFMVTNTNNFIALPYIENSYCETTESEIQYIFPSQQLGKEDTILRTEVKFTKAHTIKDFEVQQSFVWNDDGFNNNEAITYSDIENN